jgi:hypothetical protein
MIEHNRKYFRVSEMLIIDTMVYLKSEIPIQCRAPVARSQIANRENISGESLQETIVHNTRSPAHDVTDVSVGHGNSVPHPSSENRFQGHLVSPQVFPEPVSPEMLPVTAPAPNVQLEHSPSQYSSQHPGPPNPRIPACFGYDPATAEYFIPLSMLVSKKHGELIGISSLSHH